MQILDFIQSNMRSGFFDVVMPIITSLGNGGIIWILIALALIATQKYRMAGVTILAALLMHLLIGNVILKPLIARVRPCDVNTAIELLIPRPTDYSFPSGHTMSSFAAATVIIRTDKRMGIFAMLLATVIAFSRLYLYVHYPSDVVGGIVIGIALGVFASCVIAKFAKESRPERNGC